MNQILNLVGNIIFVSIPEEFFISFLILYLVKMFRIQNHDFFDINNDFAKKFVRLMLISVIPMAVISNLLIVLKINENITGNIGILLTSITMIIYLKIEKAKWKKIILTILMTAVSFLMFIIIEQCTIQLIFYITKTNREYFLQSFELKFLLTLFERAIEYAFIGFVLLNKNAIVKTNIIKTVIRSKWLLIIFTVYTLLNIVAVIFFSEAVLVNKILNDNNELYKIMWTLGVFIYVIIDISLAWLIAMLVQIKERYKYKYGKEAKI